MLLWYYSKLLNRPEIDHDGLAGLKDIGFEGGVRDLDGRHGSLTGTRRAIPRALAGT